MCYIKRDMEQVVLSLSKQYPAILINGPFISVERTILTIACCGLRRNGTVYLLTGKRQRGHYESRHWQGGNRRRA